MATIYNSELQRQLIDGARIQTAREQTPQQLADKVVPTMETNFKLLKNINIVKHLSQSASAGGTTIYTTPTNQDFYLCGVSASFTKDAACDVPSQSFIINISLPDGTTSRFCIAELLTLTAQSGNFTEFFEARPIMLARNSSITITSNVFAAGNFRRSFSIFGFVDESSRA